MGGHCPLKVDVNPNGWGNLPALKGTLTPSKGGEEVSLKAQGLEGCEGLALKGGSRGGLKVSRKRARRVTLRGSQSKPFKVTPFEKEELTLASDAGLAC